MYEFLCPVASNNVKVRVDELLPDLALRNPVGVITLGCTCEVHAPSHLLTLTSLLHVRCSRPRSSNSSEAANGVILYFSI